MTQIRSFYPRFRRFHDYRRKQPTPREGLRKKIESEKRGEVLASLSSDARDVVNNLKGRYRQGVTDEGIYLKAYSGDYCRVDRVMREPVVLRRPCLTVLWFVQPVLLDAILAERSLTEGGLIPRLLPCHTDCHPTPITGQHSGIPDEVLTAYDDLIRTLIQA